MEEKERTLVKLIVERAKELGMSDASGVNLVMDLCAIRDKISMENLLSFDNASFVHDLIGINENLNHATYEFDNCFLPRCAKEQ